MSRISRVDVDEVDQSYMCCSFCGKGITQIELIAGPTVYICYECVELCVAIVNDRKAEKREKCP